MPAFEAMRETCGREAWDEGVELVKADLVHTITPADDSHVVATVGARYETAALELRGESIGCSCTCDDRQPHGLCRHVCAMLYTIALCRRQGPWTLPDWVAGLIDGLGGKWRPRPRWRRQLESLRDDCGAARSPARASAANTEIRYTIELEDDFDFDGDPTVDGGIVVRVWKRTRKANGSWGPARRSRDVDQLGELSDDPIDREISVHLAGVEDPYLSYWDRRRDEGTTVGAKHAEFLLPLLARSGRLCYRESEDSEREWVAIELDEGPPWVPGLRIRADDARRGGASVEGAGGDWLLGGLLRRGDEEMDLAEPAMLVPGWIVARGRVARLSSEGHWPWISTLRTDGPLRIPRADDTALLEVLWSFPRLPHVDWPEELRSAEVTAECRPRLRVEEAEGDTRKHPRLRARISFRYDDHIVAAADDGEHLFLPATREILRRDSAAESQARERLLELGLREPTRTLVSQRVFDEVDLQLIPGQLSRVVARLVADGWHVEAAGKVYRQPSSFDIKVQSGIDWFDLSGDVAFGDETVALPAVLEAARAGRDTIVLGDGTIGMLPADWLRKHSVALAAAEVQDGAIRFRASQVVLLDALLAEQDAPSIDATFEKARDALRDFDGVEPAEPAGCFQGELRPYQKHGLGWFGFLERFGFGGCLADDMGLGKTVQVLAWLEARRHVRSAKKRGRRKTRESTRQRTRDHLPTLIVVPKSLLFNWRAEAARFTPELLVFDHVGTNRPKEPEALAEYDLVLTTYGTLRRDAPFLKDVRFDYVILDEAQAIKNAASASAKAARLLDGRHRLVLSGTPVENHLGELWSLFEFLNPGMLGRSKALDALSSDSSDPEARRTLARALRPLILRRTKEEVATDLPARVEQTLFCDLEPRQQRVYDEIREYYRTRLLSKVRDQGLGRAKIQILEALLRLRQAACHPGLFDAEEKAAPSAKLEILFESLREIRDEGHKVLVFSQFTKFLAILRERLDADGTRYAYLDGRTRDRAAKVAEFQDDPDCQLFLISLKAGGLGLNLTAADYVFLLDPWWNPAVEAQAIDRAHRIGQERKVFAYRIIARGTVEEKVLELQESKRQLAEEIIGADGRLMKHLEREDLELLLS